MADEARPSAATSSLTQPETRTEEQGRWGARLCVAIYVILGVLYILKAFFSR